MQFVGYEYSSYSFSHQDRAVAGTPAILALSIVMNNTTACWVIIIYFSQVNLISPGYAGMEDKFANTYWYNRLNSWEEQKQ